MTIHSAEQELLLILKKIYDGRESVNIMHWVMEHVTGKKKIDRLIDKTQALSAPQQAELQRIAAELATHRPI